MPKDNLKILLKAMDKAEGNEAMTLFAQLQTTGSDFSWKATLFHNMAHVMYAKAIGCPEHEGTCIFHEHRFDKKPKPDWQKHLLDRA